MKLSNVKVRKNPLIQVLLRFRREWLAIGILSGLVNILMLTPTMYMLQVFDRVMQSHSLFTLAVLTLLLVIFYGVQAFSEILRSHLVIGVGLKFDEALSRPIFEGAFTGGSVSAVMPVEQNFADLMRIRQWLTGPVLTAVFDLPWAPLYLAVMFILHPALGWVTVLFMLVLILFAFWAGKANEKNRESLDDDEWALDALVQTKLRNADVLEVMGMKPNLMERWWPKQINAMLRQEKAKDVEDRFNVTSKELRVLMQSLSLGVGAVLAINGEISVGAMIAASLLMARATSPIDQVVSGWSSYLAVRESFLRVNRLLQSVAHESSKTQDLDTSTGYLLLRGVSACVTNSSAPILVDISAEFKPGTVSLIMGASGAGKSTLAKVIMGIWTPSHGEVLLNGVDISAIRRDLCGEYFGYLPQDTQLFSGSIAENIARMGQVDSSKVVEAAKLTQTDKLILAMPDGYDTQIGEGGSFLSGGQRQRIALARAFYGKPKLIVLDEPNSSLDTSGDIALSAAVAAARDYGATVIVVTHKKELVACADRIFILERGKLSKDFITDSRAKPISEADLPSNVPSARAPLTS
jgi:ATP-binding cassette subfamily C exporter for protease/lipase